MMNRKLNMGHESRQLFTALFIAALMLPVLAGSPKGYLGVSIQEMTPSMLERFAVGESNGLLVTSVIYDSPAEKAGLLEDDVIVRFDGNTVSTVSAFTKMVRKTEPGKEVKIDLIRDKAKKSLVTTVGKRRTKRGHFTFFDGANTMFGGHRLGLQLHEPDENLRSYFPGAGNDGVLILSVIEDSPAEKAGLRAGDLMTAIESEKISDIEDVFDILEDYEEDDEVDISYLRKGKKASSKVVLGGDPNVRFFHQSLRDFRRPKVEHFEFMPRPERRKAPRVIVEHLKDAMEI